MRHWLQEQDPGELWVRLTEGLAYRQGATEKRLFPLLGLLMRGSNLLPP